MIERCAPKTLRQAMSRRSQQPRINSLTKQTKEGEANISQGRGPANVSHDGTKWTDVLTDCLEKLGAIIAIIAVALGALLIYGIYKTVKHLMTPEPEPPPPPRPPPPPSPSAPRSSPPQPYLYSQHVSGS